MIAASPRLGLRANAGQFALLVGLNAFVGAMVGLERSVLPLVGKDDFGLSSKSAILSFVVAFGVAKALANLAAGGVEWRPHDALADDLPVREAVDADGGGGDVAVTWHLCHVNSRSPENGCQRVVNRKLPGRRPSIAGRPPRRDRPCSHRDESGSARDPS